MRWWAKNFRRQHGLTATPSHLSVADGGNASVRSITLCVRDDASGDPTAADNPGTEDHDPGEDDEGGGGGGGGRVSRSAARAKANALLRLESRQLEVVRVDTVLGGVTEEGTPAAYDHRALPEDDDATAHLVRWGGGVPARDGT